MPVALSSCHPLSILSLRHTHAQTTHQMSVSLSTLILSSSLHPIPSLCRYRPSPPLPRSLHLRPPLPLNRLLHRVNRVLVRHPHPRAPYPPCSPRRRAHCRHVRVLVSTLGPRTRHPRPLGPVVRLPRWRRRRARPASAAVSFERVSWTLLSRRMPGLGQLLKL